MEETHSLKTIVEGCRRDREWRAGRGEKKRTRWERSGNSKEGRHDASLNSTCQLGDDHGSDGALASSPAVSTGNDVDTDLATAKRVEDNDNMAENNDDRKRRRRRRWRRKSRHEHRRGVGCEGGKGGKEKGGEECGEGEASAVAQRRAARSSFAFVDPSRRAVDGV